MANEMSALNRDRFVRLGLTIRALRKYRGLSQQQLAQRASVSRSLISAIEAPGAARPFSLQALFDIADALEIEPEKLLGFSQRLDDLLKPDL